MEFYEHLDENRRIHFQNGVVLSIQADKWAYSEPRESLPIDQFTHYEVGVVGEDIGDVDSLALYLDSKEDDFDVYGYVPAHLLEETFQHLKRRYGMKDAAVKAEARPMQEVKTAEPIIRTSIARKLKQSALIYAMKHTKDAELYDHLTDKLESTITFTED